MPSRSYRGLRQNCHSLKEDNARLQDDLRESESKYDELTEWYQNLLRENYNLENEVKKLESNLNRSNRESEKLYARLTAENQKLVAKNKQLTTWCTKAQTEIANLTAHDTWLRSQYAILLDEIESLRNGSGTTADAISHLALGQNEVNNDSSEQSYEPDLLATASDVCRLTRTAMSPLYAQDGGSLQRSDTKSMIQNARVGYVTCRHSTATFNDSHFCTVLCPPRCPQNAVRYSA